MTEQQTPSVPARLDQFPLWATQFPGIDASVAENAERAALLRRSGLALWLDRRLEEAVPIFREAAKLAPGDPKILAELGSLLSATGDQEEARDCLRASLKINPHQSQAWLTLAGLDSQSGDKRGAEHAFVEALRINPGSIEALTGLGLLHLESRRFRSAVRLLSSALQLGSVSMPVYACLGQAHYNLGEFPQAARAFEKAAQACPTERAIVKKYARVRLIEMIMTDSVESAVEAYRAIAGAEDVAVACREAFQALAGYGHREAAIRLGAALLEQNQEDPVISYHIDALSGKKHERAPEAYLSACFDGYAAHFEKHLVETLGYDVPARCAAMLGETGYAFSSMLDLGCGTGLAAPHLAPLGNELVGVDLSARMLEKARERGLYDFLCKGEAIEYLVNCDRRFSLIVALDVLVYFGDLASLFAAAAECLPPGGVLAISFETENHEAYRLQPSGRFSHNPAYVRNFAATAFDIVADVATVLRLEANAAVEGRIMLLRRR